MAIIKDNGVLEGTITTSELIQHLKSHIDVYGDTEVRFLLSGDENVQVQFEHYKSMLVIDLYEDFD